MEKDAGGYSTLRPRSERLVGGALSLDDRYPWDADRECRVDVEELGKEKKKRSDISSDSDDDDSYDEADIDWYLYEKCHLIATASSTSQMNA